MFKSILALLLATSVHAVPLNTTFGAAPAAFGFDSTVPLLGAQARCLVVNRFSAGFFRLVNRGLADSVGVTNAYTTSDAGMKFELYVTPSLAVPAPRQAEIAFEYARKYNIALKRIWLQITNPLEWNKERALNVAFINNFVRTADRFNAKVGFYTNWYDFEAITGNSGAIANADLWYWHVLGRGSRSETSKDFTDFRTFGPFSGWPIAKQYGIAETPCNVQANVNVFAGTKVAARNGNGQLPIGEGASIIKQL